MKKRTSKELDRLFKEANKCKKRKKCTDCYIDYFLECLYKFNSKNAPVLTNIAKVQGHVYCQKTSWAGDDSWTRGWIPLIECKQCSSYLGTDKDGNVECGYDERLDEWTCKQRGRFW